MRFFRSWKKVCLGLVVFFLLLAGVAYAWFYNATYQYCKTAYVDPTPVTECDRLSNDPLDPDRVAPPVWYIQDKTAARKACDDAAKQYPDSLRIKHNRVRTLDQPDKGTGKYLAGQCYRRAIGLEALQSFKLSSKSLWPRLAEEVARQKLHRAQDLGDVNAYQSEALYYLVGVYHYPKDIAFAVSLMKKSADSGDIIASSWLGGAYYGGLYVSRNVPLAAHYIFKAADSGLGLAAQFALQLVKGGVDATPEQKERWQKLVESTKNIDWRNLK